MDVEILLMAIIFLKNLFFFNYFILDYAVDEIYRNDLGFIYILTLNKENLIIDNIELIPTKIEAMSVSNCMPKLDKSWLFDHMKELCNYFHTNIKEKDNSLFISP